MKNGKAKSKANGKSEKSARSRAEVPG